MKSVAVIPIFNESHALDKLITKASSFVDHVLVVDDGSRSPIIQSNSDPKKVTILRHLVNLGKGASLTTGIQWAIQHGAEFVVLLDGDGQHDPIEIPYLLRPLLEDKLDIVFGSRSFKKNMPFVARFGNIFLTKSINLMFGIQVSDTQSGFRALRTAVYPKLAWRSPRYAVETEMVVNTGKNNLRYAEVPISTIYLNGYKGTTVLDGLRIFINMLSWKFL